MTNKNYNVVILFFDKKGTYIQTEKHPVSEVYSKIEEWSRITDGLCQIIDMHKVLEAYKNHKNDK